MAEAFQYKYDINGADSMSLDLVATTGTTFAAGDLLQFAAGGTVELATAASTRIAGVAVEGITAAKAGERVQVSVGRGGVYRVKYTPGAKSTLTQSDLGVAFDLAAGSKTINLDDVTGGMCKVVDYNNVAKTADVLIVARLLA